MSFSASSIRKRRPYAARVPAEVRRTQLLDATLAIIVREGFGKVSIDAIAREAGVTRPVVYGVFDGLGDLLSTLLDRQQQRALDQLAPLLAAGFDQDRGSVEQLPGLIRVVARAIAADPATWQPILVTPPGMPEVARARIDADRERVREVLASMIGVVFAAREAQPDVEVLAHALVAVLEHFARLLLEEPELFEIERLVSSVEVVLDAILT